MSTILTCGHPKELRWLSSCGHVQVCGVCSETRRAANAGTHWPTAHRIQERVGDELKMYDLAGRLYRNDPIRFDGDLAA